ncbi:O-antigen ligase family protein [Rhizobium cremeum]|uniref:O-antigen ligase family protein n=1 Tax=Rhizobium cremeum TaxID=2813827 RepID=UPI000DD4FC91|nr:O-antigen ligase family protein [Rhizobium cremeum]MCJ7996438.1 O-antigen ligase family protein [Rhizobium cremeum]MCJ8001697.1 O-antigen ligase family protein [Rhizobium cremeum]
MLFRYALTFFVIFVGIGVGNIVHIDSNPVEKMMLFVLGAVFLLTRKIRWDILVLIALMLLMTLISALLSSYYNLSFNRYMRSAFSLSATFLLLAGEPTKKDRDTIVRLLAALPVMMIVVGSLYQVAGIRPLFYVDFLGAPRLQGTSIPAGLGTAGYLGSVAAMLGAAFLNKKVYLPLAFVNLIILVLSAARMPLALAVAICGYVYFIMVNRSFLMRAASVGAVIPAAAGFVLLFGDSILTRFGSESLSGRDLIWEALQRVVDAYPYFGIGLGHQILVIPGDVAFLARTMAAHNEYLRITVETGYVGATAIFALLAIMCLAIWLRPATGRNFAFLLMCLSFFVYCSTDNAISSTTTPLMLVLASFAFSYRRQTVARGRPTAQPVKAASVIGPATEPRLR